MMEEQFSTVVEVMSPRWGHPDRYSIHFKPDGISVSCQGNQLRATAKLVDGELEWTGPRGPKNPLLNMFENDGIYAPAVVPEALEYAWKAWQNGEVTQDELESGLQELFGWVDLMARNKPRGMWKYYF